MKFTQLVLHPNANKSTIVEIDTSENIISVLSNKFSITTISNKRHIATSFLATPNVKTIHNIHVHHFALS